jgi:glyoxylase-like metal-dependent hydrolase (beta-lactamase superfamily II)
MKPRSIAPDLAYLRNGFVNLYLFGRSGGGDRSWVLIDAGLPGSAERILRAAEARFGWGARPAAIILTHGHFDHVGSLERLVAHWDAPVYAHPLELPYLTGRSAYPPPDPWVDRGAMSLLSPLYPRGPFEFGDRVWSLPEGGIVPGMSDWRWIHTPGHTPGHVSLFRDRDRLLIAGDAFVTTKQESLLAALTQRRRMNGPPAYFTADWGTARRSVQRLAELNPSVAATGHGRPWSGSGMQEELRRLAREFNYRAVPSTGRYVGHPAVADERGVITVPPSLPHPRARLLLGAGVLTLAGLAVARARR